MCYRGLGSHYSTGRIKEHYVFRGHIFKVLLQSLHKTWTYTCYWEVQHENEAYVACHGPEITQPELLGQG